MEILVCCVKGKTMWRLLIVLIVLTALSRLLSWRGMSDEEEAAKLAAEGKIESESVPTAEAVAGTTAESNIAKIKADVEKSKADAEKAKAEAEARRKQIASQRQELDEARRELEAAERELKELEKQYGSDAV
jgi:uncharacterized coiled-coil DUF342 family protein